MRLAKGVQEIADSHIATILLVRQGYFKGTIKDLSRKFELGGLRAC
jgi:hypothetical protein